MPSVTYNALGFQSLSTDGKCGNGISCIGTNFGSCCSIYGFCGSTPDYCAANKCQPLWGACIPPDNAAVPASPTTSQPQNSNGGGCYASFTVPDYCATIPPFPTSDIKSSDCEAAAAACTASADDCTNQVNMEIEAEDAVDLGSPAVCSGMYGVCGEKAGACFADATP